MYPFHSFLLSGKSFVYQTALPVLVHRHAPSNPDQKKLLHQKYTATAGTQSLSPPMR
jgi:hypothetical protein